MKLGCCYTVSGAVVREYFGQKFFSTSKNGSVIKECEQLKVSKKSKYQLLVRVCLQQRTCMLLVSAL